MGITITELVPDFDKLHEDEQATIAEAAEKGRTYFSPEHRADDRMRDIAHAWLIREALRLVIEARAMREREDTPMSHEQIQQQVLAQENID